MKIKLLILLITICGMSVIHSCQVARSVESVESKSYGMACPSPIYIATVAKEATLDLARLKYEPDNPVISSGSLSLVSLFREAQAKYGSDVTIQNVRWDIKNGKRYAVLYDVIKCK